MLTFEGRQQSCIGCNIAFRFQGVARRLLPQPGPTSGTETVRRRLHPERSDDFEAALEVLAGAGRVRCGRPGKSRRRMSPAASRVSRRRSGQGQPGSDSVYRP